MKRTRPSEIWARSLKTGHGSRGPTGWCSSERRGQHRGTTFGRKWRKARDKVGLPKHFRSYDLRHTGNTLAADTGAKLKDYMIRGPTSRPRRRI